MQKDSPQLAPPSVSLPETASGTYAAGLTAGERQLLTAYCLFCGILGCGVALVAVAWYAMISSMAPGFVQAVIVVAAFLCSAGIGYLSRHNKWVHRGLLFYGGLVVLAFVGIAVATIIHAYVNRPDNIWIGAVIVVACLPGVLYGLSGVAAAAFGRSLRRHLGNAHATYGLTVCQCCNYDLRGSQHSTTCPECGELIAKPA